MQKIPFTVASETSVSDSWSSEKGSHRGLCWAHKGDQARKDLHEKANLPEGLRLLLPLAYTIQWMAWILGSVPSLCPAVVPGLLLLLLLLPLRLDPGFYVNNDCGPGRSGNNILFIQPEKRYRSFGRFPIFRKQIVGNALYSFILFNGRVNLWWVDSMKISKVGSSYCPLDLAHRGME